MFQVMMRMFAALLVVSAIAAPAASARPTDPVRPEITAHVTTTKVLPESSALPVRTGTASDGFNWDDAGIGAAGMFMLFALGTGAVLVGRRGRAHRSAATS